MKDKSKRLTVVNTGKKPSEKKEEQQVVVQSSSSSSSHASGFNSNLYLLKSVWDSVFEIKTDVSGQKYLFGKLPVVTQYGVTMYGDNDELNVPDIYEGLPIDNITLYWDNGVLKAKGGEGGGGGVADSISWANVYGKPSWVTDTKPIYNYSEINGTPDLSVFVTDTALSNTLADYATLSYLTGELKKYVTIIGDQEIVGVKNFLNGLKIGGLPITKKQDDVVFLDANLVVRGGITMYAENEVNIPSILDSLPIASNTALGIASFDSTYFSVDSNGMVSLTSAPSSGASSLGELLNVDASIDATASVDRILYQPRGSSVWTWRELPKDGVVGDYLPLTGGTLTGGVVIAPSASYTTAITDSCTVLKLGSDTSGVNGYNSGLGFNALQRYSSHYLLHLHAWIGLSPCINSAGSELYDLVFATNGSTTVKTSPIERMRITHDGSVKIQRLFFGNTNEINSTDGSTLCLNYEGTGNILMSNNGQGVVVATGWNGLSSTTQQRLRKSMFSVRGGIFSYMEDVISNAAAYVFDKPGMHFTGIGSNGEADTIYFGAVDTTNLYSWVSYSQIWKFGGSIITTGGITMYSDKRKKTILNHVELSLKQIADAPLIEHYYNSDQEKTTHVGSIAQYWASMNDWFCKLDSEGFYTMEIQNCALASAISIARHLEKYESKTDKKIRQLKKRVAELEDKLEKLEGGSHDSI